MVWASLANGFVPVVFLLGSFLFFVEYSAALFLLDFSLCFQVEGVGVGCTHLTAGHSFFVDGK